jgi:hypothetical protein
MLTLSNKNKPHNFICLCCDFSTSKKGNYNTHLLTAKHKILTLPNKNKPDDNTSNNDIDNLYLPATQYKLKTSQNKPKQAKILSCVICNKIYNSRAGLWLHKKKCIILQKEAQYEVPIPVDSTKLTVNSDIILEIIKENQEFKTLLINQQKENNLLINKMMEISQNTLTIPTTINNTTTNNQFNLNLFLNENCKNAINFSDFIDNIQLTDDDLENNAKMGFVEGVTKIIMDNLKQLALTDRPIHCTDVKRETIYVKEEEQWDKENSNKVIQRGIQDITCKNMQQLCQWREENPSYADDMDSELGEKSIVMQQNSMAGPKRDDYYPKIIRNIAKETVLDKKRMLE